MYSFPKAAVRAAYGMGALVLGDLVLGLAAFSCISAATLWVFSMGWIRLQGEYAAIGLSFGTSFQLDLAWVGAIAGLPALIGIVYLGVSALRLPLRLFRHARSG
jgi:hypothetical protein